MVGLKAPTFDSDRRGTRIEPSNVAGRITLAAGIAGMASDPLRYM